MTSQLGLHPSFAVIPLVSQSLTVFFAGVETTIFISFLRAAETDHAAVQRTARLWWKQWLPWGLSTIFAVTLPGICAGVYAARQLPSDSLEWKLYAAGAAFGSGHFLAGPTISKVIDKICDEEVEKSSETMKYIKRWLQVHTVRTLAADIPALFCFAYLVFGK
ncbi:uncharacterized protein HMPREF1541_02471 [Cyphellophora europaea CBS 101466]|uniref:Integral membrane protein n=1 Tax=Cyphellophora europaea (strain CBS 101466) TaxID=1220924 RepID=W2S3Q4_CYPE1|nr:uncharacterized protein HMPREF1541_02471 [Cyphellophora europaea CBS 101466]ETN43312.1 hypothetical protein HMPREF1541_02471 [Cyphellophora europaea CBS 101466]